MKIGQRVTVVYEKLKDCDTYFMKRVKGRAGTVDSYKNGYIQVLLDNDRATTPFYPSELMPERIYSTNLAKKIYPNWEEEDGWLYPKNS